jgi:hypothetical protein
MSLADKAVMSFGAQVDVLFKETKNRLYILTWALPSSIFQRKDVQAL